MVAVATSELIVPSFEWYVNDAVPVNPAAGVNVIGAVQVRVPDDKAQVTGPMLPSVPWPKVGAESSVKVELSPFASPDESVRMTGSFLPPSSSRSAATGVALSSVTVIETVTVVESTVPSLTL
jgi:hypothetical protein